jgi:uncharacterized protein
LFKPQKLGVGLVYDSFLLDSVRKDPKLVDFLELEPETLWVQLARGQYSFRMMEAQFTELTSLACPKLLHSVGFPVAGSSPAPLDHVGLLNSMADTLGSPWVSEHLSFNTAMINGTLIGTGMMLPQLQTPEGVAHAVRNTRTYAAALNRPLALETGINYLQPHPFEMSDGRFICEVVENADCGILLDLHNLWLNELNGRQRVLDLIAELPLDRVWEVHVAGGEERNGYWIDSHCGAVPEQLRKLARKIIPFLPNLGAVTLEVFPAYLPELGVDGLRREIEVFREICAISPTSQTLRRPATEFGLSSGAAPSVVDWERALAEAILRRDQTTEFGKVLTMDPAMPLYSELLEEFRSAMLATSLGLTMRLLMLNLDDRGLRELFASFWREAPPEMSAAAEALQFGDFLLTAGLDIPLLEEIVSFEMAAVRSVMTNEPQRVRVECDIRLAIDALVDGRRPAPAGPTPFEFVIDPPSDASRSFEPAQPP